MTITLNYGVVFGKGDSSDVFEWDIVLSEEQEKAYKRAIITGASFEEVPELKSLCDEAYLEIEDQELDTMRELGYEYALECLGEIKVDADEINELVRSKDIHTIEFFGLSELTDEEIEEWDANDLNELPLIKDFQEGFEPQSPFDCGWCLNVWLPENDKSPKDEEIEIYLKEALSSGDTELAEEIVNGQEDNYSDDLAEVAFRIAVQVGCEEYVRNHYEDVELNTDDGWSSPYLSETDDKDMRALLIESGARVNWEEYDGYSLAVETVNGSVLSFTEEFQEEVYKKLLDVLGIGESYLVALLESEDGPKEKFDIPENLNRFSLEEICDALQLEVKESRIELNPFGFMDSEYGWTIKDIVETLGWNLEFEGDQWKLETSGVFFIE